MKNFSSPKMRNREFVFTPKIEYKLVAKRGEPKLFDFSFLVPSAGIEPASYPPQGYVLSIERRGQSLQSRLKSYFSKGFYPPRLRRLGGAGPHPKNSARCSPRRGAYSSFFLNCLGDSRLWWP